MTDIRLATLEDTPVLLDMAVMMHAESPQYREIPLSLRKLTALVHDLIASPAGRILVAQRGGEVIGSFWGYVCEYFFSEALTASDVLLYIRPEHRGGFAARRLVRDFEVWAALQGAVKIQPGVSTGIDNQSYARFYELMDYTITGYNLSKAASDVR